MWVVLGGPDRQPFACANDRHPDRKPDYATNNSKPDCDTNISKPYKVPNRGANRASKLRNW